eukprot:IDg6368t1
MYGTEEGTTEPPTYILRSKILGGWDTKGFNSFLNGVRSDQPFLPIAQPAPVLDDQGSLNHRVDAACCRYVAEAIASVAYKPLLPSKWLSPPGAWRAAIPRRLAAVTIKPCPAV